MQGSNAGMATRKRASARGAGKRWEDLNCDLLVNIFRWVGVENLVTSIPMVCSSWRSAARDPRCWLELDFRRWDFFSGRIGASNCNDFIRLLRFALDRGQHGLKSIYFPEFADEKILLSVAARCPALEYFSLPNDVMDEGLFMKAVSKLGFLSGMTVVDHLMTSEVLQHVNQRCPHLTQLGLFSEYVDEKMASVICESLPSIRKLEITDSAISSQAIIAFLDGLKELEHFDISGYINSGITDVILHKVSRLKVFIWNSSTELGEFLDCATHNEFKNCSTCDEDWMSEIPCQCMLDRKVLKWLTQIS